MPSAMASWLASSRRRAVLLASGAMALSLVALYLAARSPGKPSLATRPAPVPDGRPALLTPATALSPRNASYRIDARLDVATHQLTATQTLTWTNPGGSAVSELPFHLYLNGFKNETTLFMRSSRGEHRGQRATDAGWGWIDVTSITIDGAERRPQARHVGPDETVLEVPLATPVPPGGTIAVTMAFTAQLPEVFARTGYRGDFHMVGQWFPKIGVRAGAPGFEQWHCQPFHVNSEFFADFGTYDVTLTVPATHVVAATGVLVSVEDRGDERTLAYRAEDVHDFAWMADPFMDVLRGTAKVAPFPVAQDAPAEAPADAAALREVEVRVYFRPGHRAFAERHLGAAIGAIEAFSEMYVPYPWSIMTVIDPPLDAAASAGGMEYPTLVTTSEDGPLTPDGVRVPEFVTIHEVGHNWFQGMLASNEVDEAWLDEGVNEYADSLVMTRLWGERAAMVEWGGHEVGTDDLRYIAVPRLADIPAPIATASYAFPDNESYGQATYVKTEAVLRTLEHVVGSERMAAAMKVYARRFAFRHPTGADFQQTLATELADAAGGDLAWFFGPAFHEIGAADYRLRSATCRAKRAPRGVFGDGDERRVVTSSDAPDGGSWVCDVVVVNLGRVGVPVDIELRFADGTRQVEHWDDRGQGHAWHLELERSSELTAVVIDPERKVLLNDGLFESRVRLRPDPRASRRAAARAGFWTQTAMQIVGL
jgi:hypothetical protein